ncbi:hypothetical protein B566_EDAN005111 [Ephemera danica]|nr:hypothetical protein B566_EDAN005111 [Ephemera danica]
MKLALMDLEDSRVTGVPDKIYYIPNFITEDEETMLINQINNSPKPKWTQLAHRRLQNWGGLPHVKGMIAEDLPGWLSAQVDKVSQLGLFEADKRPNHVLINEYLPGQGIMVRKTTHRWSLVLPNCHNHHLWISLCPRLLS